MESEATHVKSLPSAAAQVVDLSDADDPRWAGVVTLAPFCDLPWIAAARHDVYVLRGSVTEPGAEHGEGTFVSRDHRSGLAASGRGATLLVYRDQFAAGGGNHTLPAAAQRWYPGRVDGMSATLLSEHHHRLILVRWKAGTRTRMHQHPWGEEIYVLEGVLQDQRGRYPAGSWQRLRADSGHAPFAEEDTLIMLRNGHLRDEYLTPCLQPRRRSRIIESDRAPQASIKENTA